AEFSAIRQRRADAGLGWLTASPDVLPAPLEAMSLGEFEPEAWIPSSHPAARRGVISLDELASLAVIHGARRASTATYRSWRKLPAAGKAGGRHSPPCGSPPPPGPPSPADVARLRRPRQPAHRGADRPPRHRRTPTRRDPAPPPSGHRRHDPGLHRRPAADRH